MRLRGYNRCTLRHSAVFTGSLLALLLAGCEQQKQAAAPPPPPPEVVLAVAVQETVPLIVQESGTIMAVKYVKIIQRVTGFIDERFFTEVTFVDFDAPLYQIDPRPFEERLARLEAQLKGQQATLEFWQSEEKRYTKLSKVGAASVEEAESARAKLHNTRADIEATEAQIRNAELDVGYTKIKAPFYGRIQQTRINVGNLVTKEKDVLTSLAQMDPIYVIFHASRAQVYRIQKLRRQGDTFELQDMIVEVVLPDGQVYPRKGKVNFVSLEIDPTTDSVAVRGIFENPKNHELGDFDLIPGQYVPVRFTVGETHDAPVIPQTAVVQTQAGAHVYVVGPDNKAELRPVELGRPHGAKIIVNKGLKKGERVVAVGVQKVRSGVEVRPIKAAMPDKDAHAGG